MYRQVLGFVNGSCWLDTGIEVLTEAFCDRGY